MAVLASPISIPWAARAMTPWMVATETTRSVVRTATITFTGGAGDDRLWGGAGDDTLYGWQRQMTFIGGGSGADLIHGGTGNDTLYGGSGKPDTIYADSSPCHRVQCNSGAWAAMT